MSRFSQFFQKSRKDIFFGEKLNLFELLEELANTVEQK